MTVGIVAAIATVTTGYAVAGMWRRAKPARASSLNQTVLPARPDGPLRLPALVSSHGDRFGSERLHGRWSLIFFGYTKCPDVCPTALMALSGVARRADSGVPDGRVQLMFVSTDPTDTRDRIDKFLSNFDPHIIGLTGERDSVATFVETVGASSTASGSVIDHSTSVFVIDPRGRLAGVLLRPSNPAQIVADVEKLRASSDVSGTR